MRPAYTGLRFLDPPTRRRIVQHNLSRADFPRFVHLPEDRRAAPLCRCADTVEIEQPRSLLCTEHAAEIPIQRVHIIVGQARLYNGRRDIRGFNRCRSGVDNGLAKYSLDTSVIIGHRFGVISEIFAWRIVVTASLLVVALANRRGKTYQTLLSDKASFLAAVRAVNLAPVAVLFQVESISGHNEFLKSVCRICTLQFLQFCSSRRLRSESFSAKLQIMQTATETFSLQFS